MDQELYQKMDELFKLLDDNINIKNLTKIKGKIDNEVLSLINEYHVNPTVENKKKLYKNSLFQEYIKNETELNYLIMEINSKFKRRRDYCAHN